MESDFLYDRDERMPEIYIQGKPIKNNYSRTSFYITTGLSLYYLLYI